MSPTDALPEGWELLPPDHPLQHRPRVGGPEPERITTVRSLQDLIDRALGRGEHALPEEDAGLAEVVPFPFLALVGQREMQLALLLAVVHPRLGGVLLVGPSGSGKSTAARGIVDLLPPVARSLCYYGCLPEDIAQGGLEAVCQDCARKYQAGQPLAVEDRARFLELPPTVDLDTLFGAPEARGGHRRRWRKGLLAQADRHVLYLDELGRYPPVILDAVLDAITQGHYTVHRGGWSATYRSRALLIATADPHNAPVARRYADRFALCACAHPLGQEERATLYHRWRAWQTAPGEFAARYQTETQALRQEVRAARELLAQVRLSEKLLHAALQVTHQAGLSPRADYAWVEAARAHAAAAGRVHVTPDDLRMTLPLALRCRGRDLTPALCSGTEDEARWQATLEDALRTAPGPAPTVSFPPEEEP